MLSLNFWIFSSERYCSYFSSNTSSVIIVANASLTALKSLTVLMSLLNKSHIRVYNLCFDGDAGGDKGIKEFMEHIRKDVMVNIVRLPRGKDINDLSYEEVENMLNEQLGI